MIQKITRTAFPPPAPLLVWDGACGFCAFWVRRWQNVTGPAVQYERFQTAEADFPDIPRERFAEAVRLIEPDGRVYTGAEAAYRAFTYGRGWSWTYSLYRYLPPFRWVSDRVYYWVTQNRPFLYKINKALFGKDKEHPKRYWAGYLGGALLLGLWWWRRRSLN